MADTQRDGRDARTNAGSPERPGRAPGEGVDRVPWRVEGARRSGGDTGPARPRLFGPRFWLALLGLLVLNLPTQAPDVVRRKHPPTASRWAPSRHGGRSPSAQPDSS
jgi:hypothetical protein